MKYQEVYLGEGDEAILLGVSEPKPEPKPVETKVVVIPSLHPMMQSVVTMFAHRGAR